MPNRKISFLLFACFLFWNASAHASWLIYYKPEFRGKVIEAETKVPIEGAVVAVYYMTNTYNIAGGGTRVIKTRETSTDENGEFLIQFYITLFSPFTTSDEVGFIIYKPGYGGYPEKTGLCVGSAEEYFSAETQGIQSECLVDNIAYKFIYGVIEMPKLTKDKERLRAIPSIPLLLGVKDFPFLYKLMNEERKRFGLGEVN